MNDAFFSTVWKPILKQEKVVFSLTLHISLFIWRKMLEKLVSRIFITKYLAHPCTTKRFIIVLATLVINGNFIALHGDFQIIPSFYITIMLFSHCVSASVFNLISRSATSFYNPINNRQQRVFCFQCFWLRRLQRLRENVNISTVKMYYMQNKLCNEPL